MSHFVSFYVNWINQSAPANWNNGSDRAGLKGTVHQEEETVVVSCRAALWVKATRGLQKEEELKGASGAWSPGPALTGQNTRVQHTDGTPGSKCMSRADTF